MLVMNIWLTIRTFGAVFLLFLGIGLLFVRTEEGGRIFIGALLIAIGVTFLLRLALALRKRSDVDVNDKPTIYD